MPLIQIHPLNDISAWALWRIDESQEELASLPLCDHERTELSQIHNERRRLEWLGARNALQGIIERQMIEKKSILKDGFGKPFLMDSSHHISIAHSFPYAAAIFNRIYPAGIDLERIQDKILKIGDKFLNRKEAASCNGDPATMTVYWCAKEALYKLYGKKRLVFKENLFVNPFSMQSSGDILGMISIDEERLEVRLHYEKLDNYIVCLTVDQNRSQTPREKTIH